MVEQTADNKQDTLIDYDQYVELVDGDDEYNQGPAQEQVTGASKPTAFVGVHATSFKDMLLKPELQRAIVDCGFEHPSDV